MIVQEKPFSFALLVDVHCVSSELTEYRNFYQEVEWFLAKQDERLQQHVGEIIEGATSEGRDEVVDSYASDLHQYQSLFPAMHRQAMFITLYNFLEHNLNNVCVAIAEEIGIELKLKDMHGRGIQRAFLFIQKVIGFKLAGAEECIAFLRRANALRNTIVHAGGLLPDDGGNVVNQFVQSSDNLRGKPGNVVTIQAGFVSEVAEVIRELFVQIENEMQRYMGNKA